jgi:hypothetical protein
MEEDIQVILIHFCGKLKEGNISQKRNPPIFGELVAWPSGYASNFQK